MLCRRREPQRKTSALDPTRRCTRVRVTLAGRTPRASAVLVDRRGIIVSAGNGASACACAARLLCCRA